MGCVTSASRKKASCGYRISMPMSFHRSIDTGLLIWSHRVGKRKCSTSPVRAFAVEGLPIPPLETAAAGQVLLSSNTDDPQKATRRWSHAYVSFPKSKYRDPIYISDPMFRVSKLRLKTVALACSWMVGGPLCLTGTLPRRSLLSRCSTTWTSCWHGASCWAFNEQKRCAINLQFVRSFAVEASLISPS